METIGLIFQAMMLIDNGSNQAGVTIHKFTLLNNKFLATREMYIFSWIFMLTVESKFLFIKNELIFLWVQRTLNG